MVRKDAALQCEAEAEGSLPEELEGLTINDSYASLVSKEPLGQSKFIVTWKPYELTEDGSLFSCPQSHYRSQ